MRAPRRTLALAVLAIVLLELAGTATAGAAAMPHGRLGVFRGSGRADLVGEYEAWVGRSVGYTVDFVGKSSSSTAPWAKIDDPSWWCRQWRGRSSQLVLSTAMLPNSSFTLAAGAQGAYDAHWRSFAQTLVREGCPSAILRLGWEFNGKFYPWAAGGKEATFAAYWRRIVEVIRTVPGQAFTYDWTPLAGNTNANVEAAYPGDAYVDIIGLDAYDTSTVPASNPTARWQDQLTRPWGLNWQAAFAAAHRKPMSLPEWGLTVRPTDNLGGGDNPHYITQMWNWIATHNYRYAAYFEVDAADASHRLMTTQFPNASREFRRLASGAATTTTTAAPTTSTTAAPTTTTTVAPTTTTTTAPPPVTAPVESIWSGATRPSGISSDARAVEVGVKFRTSRDGSLLGIRFYKAAANVGPHVASLWTTSGALLARAPFVSETAEGWQEVRFANPVSVRAGTTYIASYHTTAGRYAEDQRFFYKSVSNGSLTALKSGIDGSNGVYSYGDTPTFPARGANKARNYWVDVVFRAG